MFHLSKLGQLTRRRFANEESLKEIRRVLKPGGKLGVIWNIEDCTLPAMGSQRWTLTFPRHLPPRSPLVPMLDDEVG